MRYEVVEWLTIKMSVAIVHFADESVHESSLAATLQSGT
jgi:hypothetical protein